MKKSIGSLEKCKFCFNPIFERVNPPFQTFPNNWKIFYQFFSTFIFDAEWLAVLFVSYHPLLMQFCAFKTREDVSTNEIRKTRTKTFLFQNHEIWKRLLPNQRLYLNTTESDLPCWYYWNINRKFFPPLTFFQFLWIFRKTSNKTPSFLSSLIYSC